MKSAWLAGVLALVNLAPPGDGKSPPPSTRSAPIPADFKLQVRLYGAEKEPRATADLLVHDGIAYQLLAETPDEVIVIDPARSRVVLVDIDRKRQAEITAARLDAAVGQLYETLHAEVGRREKRTSRSDRVTASMTRDLIDPDFKITRDADRLTLSNPTVEVKAKAVDEPDLGRLIVIMNTLAAINKLDALRDPETIPPFTRLAALRAVSESGKQRPSELSYLYRLAGPPRKVRWVYTVVPSLTDRERNAVIKLEAMRAKMPVVSLEDYDAEEPG